MKNIILISIILFINNNIFSQIDKAPERYRGEGPYNQLIIRGATLINGNGAPPTGPVDVVIEKNIIKKIINVGYPASDPYLKKEELKLMPKENIYSQDLLICTDIFHLRDLVQQNMYLNFGWLMG